MIANTPKPPYYAVIFSTIRTDVDRGYTEVLKKIKALAKLQEGFLGMEAARNGVGITVSYWKSLETILRWKHNTEHSLAQEKGKELWYKKYQLRICKVERAYEFEK